MNTTKLEKQCLNWAPRRPSDNLRRKLFGDAPELDDAPAFNWLAPLAACLLVLVVVCGAAGGSGGAPFAANGSEAMTYGASNTGNNLWHQQDVALSTLDSNLQRTLPMLGTLGWTNHALSTSSNAALLLAATNQLIR